MSAVPEEVLSQAQGCLLGQLAGDSLGSLVECEDAATIRAQYPQGVRELADGGVWNTIAGQPTDDSEMALALARSLVRNGKFSIPGCERMRRDGQPPPTLRCGNADRCPGAKPTEWGRRATAH